MTKIKGNINVSAISQQRNYTSKIFHNTVRAVKLRIYSYLVNTFQLSNDKHIPNIRFTPINYFRRMSIASSSYPKNQINFKRPPSIQLRKSEKETINDSKLATGENAPCLS